MRPAAIGRGLDAVRGVVALGVLAVVVASLMSGELPFSIEVWQVLIAGVALHGATGLIRWELSGRRLGPVATVRSAFEQIDSSVTSVATAVTGRPMTGAGRSLGAAFVATIALQVALAARAMSSVVGWPLPDPQRNVEMVLLAGAVLVSVPLLRAIGVIIPQRLRRGSARIGSQLQVQMDGDDVEVLDVGPLGMGVRVAEPAEVGSGTALLLRPSDGSAAVRVRGTVRSSLPLADDTHRLGVEFDDTDPAVLNTLMGIWAAAWIPAAADPGREPLAPRSVDDLRVRVNHRSSPALRLLAAVTLIATGAAALPPYASASADAPLPQDTLALTKSLPASTLYGDETAVSLTAHNTWSTDDAGVQRYFNVSFRDVVPPGASYVAGSADIAPTRVIADQPSAGATTLIWVNVSDAQPGSSTSVSYRIAHNVSGKDDSALFVGSEVGSTAEAFANTDPRYITKFAPDGTAVAGKDSWTDRATAAGSTTIVPLIVSKSEPSPENELMRGAHRPTVFTVRVENNLVAPTDRVSVEDWLPAELEFLGCGTVDHTPDTPNTPGGLEYPGAPRLDKALQLNADEGCVAPELVETVDIDPDGAGPLLSGIYTHVRWTIGELAPGASREITYLAAVPERANALWPADPESGAPDPICGPGADSCGQVANLANNTGALTTERGTERSATNGVAVAGAYTGRVPAGVAAEQTWARTTETVVIEDLAVQKSACNSAANGNGTGRCRNGVEYGGTTSWNLSIRTGEYRDAAKVVVTDDLPDGLTFRAGSSAVSVDGTRTPLEPEVSEGRNGVQTLRWTLPMTIGVDSELQLSFESVTLEAYRATGQPVLVFDTLQNRVSLSGTTSVVNGDDDLGAIEVGDTSGASLSSSWYSVAKQTLSGAAAAQQRIGDEQCSAGWVDAGDAGDAGADGPRFAPGDLVCFDLAVDLPAGIRMRDVVITDFLPANARFVGAVDAADNTPGQFDAPEVVPSFGNAVTWNYGTPIGTQPRYTPADGGRFHVVLGARVTNDPRANSDADLYQNLLKVTIANTAGASTVSPRALSPYQVAEPVLSLVKGVVDITRGEDSLNGYPRKNPAIGRDAHTAIQGDLVTYRVDVANTGIQLRDNGRDPLDPSDDVASTRPRTTPTARTPTRPLLDLNELRRRNDTIDFTQPQRSSRLATGLRINRADGQVQASDAFDVQIWDDLPPEISCADMLPEAGFPEVSSALVLRPGALPLATAPVAALKVDCSTDPSRLAIVVDRIPAGYDLQLSYTARVRDTAAAGSSHLDTAGVRSYLDLTGTDLYLPEQNIDPKVIPNAPPAIDDSLVRLPDAQVAKTRVTSIVEANNDLPAKGQTGQATIGEEVRYTVRATIPAGTTLYRGSLADTLPAGLSYAAGSARLELSDGVDAEGFTLSDRKDGRGWTLDLPATFGNSSANDQVVTVTYVGVVADATANRHGTALTNTARLSWRFGEKATSTDRSRSSQSTTRVVEPSPSITKSHTPISTVVGTNRVDYTVSVANAAGRPPLHDVIVTDCVPAGLSQVTPTGPLADAASVEEGVAPCATDATLVRWDLSKLLEDPGTRPNGLGLQPGERIALTYSATVDAPAVAGAELINTATVTGSSISGDVKGERTSYSASTKDTIKVAPPVITKSVDPGTRLPGTEASYSLAITVPEGVTVPDATVIDVLPANLLFGGYTDLAPLGASCEVDGVQPHTIAASGQRVGWFLGDLSAVGADCTIRLTYTATVRSAAVAGNVLTNTATLRWNLVDRFDDIDELSGNGFDSSRDATAKITVVEPVLTIGKNLDDADRVVEAGQRLTYTITITNSGTHPAYDITTTDSYPSGLSAPESIGGSCIGSDAATVDGEERVVTWATLFAGTDGLAAGASCTLTYSQRVDPAAADTLNDGGTLVNTAAIPSFWGDPTHDGDDFKEYRGPSADATVTTYLPQLSIQKRTGSGAEVADADVGSAFAWTLEVANTGKGTAYGVDVTDTLPANWTFDTGSVTVSADPGAACRTTPAQLTPPVSTTPVDGGAQQRIIWTDLCDLAPASTVTLRFTATPLPAATVVPGLLDDDGDKVRQVNDAEVGGSDAGGTALAGDRDDAAATLRTADLRILKTDASADDDGSPGSAGFTVGQPGSYYLDVTNAGPDPATGPIVVTDSVPTGLRATGASGDGWSCEINAGTDVRCTRPGPLAAGATAPRIVLGVDVGLDALNLDDDTGLVTNTASVTAVTPDPDPGNSSDDEPTPVRRVSDMSIAKSLDTTTPFVPGTDLRYLVTVTNLGPSPARGAVTVTDALPARTRLVQVTGDGWDCAASVLPTLPATAGTASTAGSGFSGTTQGSGRVSCVRTAADSPTGAAYPTIVVTAAVDPATPARATVTNVAKVAHPNDPNPDNDSSDNSSSADPVATLSISKSDGDATFRAGQDDARYYVVVSNTGPSVETGPVVLSDSIGEHLRLVSVDAPGWDCDVTVGTGFGDGNRGELDCTWVGPDAGPDPVRVGESLGMVTVQVAVDPAAVADPRPGAENLVSNTATVIGVVDDRERSDTEDTPVVPVAQLRIDKSHDADSAPWTVGSDQQFRLLVGNDGPSGEYGRVVVTDVLPEGLEYREAGGRGWACELRTGGGNGPNGTVRCVHSRSGLDDDVVLLAAGAELPPIDVGVRVMPAAAPTPQPDPDVTTNTVTNSATAAGVTDDVDRTDDDTVTVRPVADLRITKDHEGDAFQVGATGEYTFVITNDGPNLASGPITVTDTLPAGLSFAGGTGNGWVCAAVRLGTDITCTHEGELGVDESSTITVTVDVAPEAYRGADDPTLSNTAEVSGPTVDDDPENNSDDDQVRIDPLVDLAIDKSHDGDFSVASPGSFTLAVTNNGPNDLPVGPVTVSDTLPDGLEFRSAEGDGWTCSTDTDQRVITCTADAALAVGDRLPALTVTVDVTPAAEPEATNVAEVSTPVTDADPSNNRDEDTVAVVPLANISVTKTLLGQLTVGQEGLWRIEVRNDGPSPASDVTVTDELPAVFDDVTASGTSFDCTVVGRRVTCQRSTPLPADATAELVIAGTVTDGGGSSVVNTATATTSTNETDPDDNSGSASGQIIEVAERTQGNAAAAGATAAGGTAAGGTAAGGTARSLPERLAYTGLTILGLLAAAGAFLVGGFLLTGFGRRRDTT